MSPVLRSAFSDVNPYAFHVAGPGTRRGETSAPAPANCRCLFHPQQYRREVSAGVVIAADRDGVPGLFGLRLGQLLVEIRLQNGGLIGPTIRGGRLGARSRGSANSDAGKTRCRTRDDLPNHLSTPFGSVQSARTAVCHGWILGQRPAEPADTGPAASYGGPRWRCISTALSAPICSPTASARCWPPAARPVRRGARAGARQGRRALAEPAALPLLGRGAGAGRCLRGCRVPQPALADRGDHRHRPTTIRGRPTPWCGRCWRSSTTASTSRGARRWPPTSATSSRRREASCARAGATRSPAAWPACSPPTPGNGRSCSSTG